MMVKYITVEVMNGPMKEIMKPEGESKNSTSVSVIAHQYFDPI